MRCRRVYCTPTYQIVMNLVPTVVYIYAIVYNTFVWIKSLYLPPTCIIRQVNVTERCILNFTAFWIADKSSESNSQTAFEPLSSSKDKISAMHVETFSAVHDCCYPLEINIQVPSFHNISCIVHKYWPLTLLCSCTTHGRNRYFFRSTIRMTIFARKRLCLPNEIDWMSNLQFQYYRMDFDWRSI